ncbi:DUF6489 family protein [Sphingomonas sp.]|uniref:DUF6489 family protein n=1 Tax=Sphingomonas sp. TaxID=28214 RepID=UPI003B00621E
MKITIDFDCTPEEARRVMGLPDLSPLHHAYVDHLRQALGQGLTPDTVAGIMQAWTPMGDAGVSLWKQMLDQLGSPKSG